MRDIHIKGLGTVPDRGIFTVEKIIEQPEVPLISLPQHLRLYLKENYIIYKLNVWVTVNQQIIVAGRALGELN